MSLEPFWQFVEARPGGVAVMAEWRGRCGDAVADGLLQPTGELATSYPAPKAGRPPLRVVHHANGTFVGVCDDGRSDRVSLDRSDVVLHGLDLAVLRKRLCEALGLKVAREPVGDLPGAVRIGTWEPRPSLAIPVVLLVAVDEAMLRQALHDLAQPAKKPVVLLLPTRALWHDRATALADERKATLVPLSEVVKVKAGRWAATEAWPKFCDGHLERTGLTTPGRVRAAQPKKKRDTRASAIDRIKGALREHLLAAKAHARATAAASEVELLPRPTQAQLAKQLGLSESAVSRCLTREPDRELQIMWVAATDLDSVQKYRG